MLRVIFQITCFTRQMPRVKCQACQLTFLLTLLAFGTGFAYAPVSVFTRRFLDTRSSVMAHLRSTHVKGFCVGKVNIRSM